MAALLKGSDITANSQSTLSHRCQTADLASSGWERASACFCLSLYPGLYSHGGLLWQELKMTAVCTRAWESLCIQVGSCLMVTILKSGWSQAAIPWHRLEYVCKVMRIPDQRTIKTSLFNHHCFFFYPAESLSESQEGTGCVMLNTSHHVKSCSLPSKKYWVNFKKYFTCFFKRCFYLIINTLTKTMWCFLGRAAFLQRQICQNWQQ